MKIAITDACIFIDLYELNLTTAFFQLNLEVHATLDVYFELYPEQQKLLDAFASVDKLFLHDITHKDRIAIYEIEFPRSLSDVDKTVLYIAQKQNAMVLSSDKAVRNYAKKQVIDYHGILWIFDQLVDQNILSTNEATSHLEKLMKLNLIYGSNQKLKREFEKRFHHWKRNN